MKCNSKRLFSRLPVNNVWEVRLDQDIWRLLEKKADAFGCSYSWITRYTVFRLIRKKRIKMYPVMEKLNKNIRLKTKQSKNPKRHMVCLYGEDEKLLRMTAMDLGITVSQLIRISLYWFLPRFKRKKIDFNQVFYFGTKICRYFNQTRTNSHDFPFFDNIFFTKWPKEKWWNLPHPVISIPISP